MTAESSEAPPVFHLRGDDELASLLRRFQMLLLEHPVAAQRLFGAFVAEGRRFAETEEGRAWQNRLQSSELVHRARVAWDVVTLRMLEPDPDAVLPSALLDAFVRTAAVDGLEPMLSKLFEEGLFGE
ncbi:MAG: hypothetical protein AAF799_08145 [Myxococcota bacterium]